MMVRFVQKSLVVGILVCLLPSLFSAPNGWNYLTLQLAGKINGDFFGYSLADAGDVNGDGYTDIIIGAPGTGGAGVDPAYPGRAYLFFGGPNADANADVTFFGAAAGDRFGMDVAGAGDVNGDGYADIIIGAPFNDAAGTNAGRWSIYFGGPVMNNVADLTRNGISGGLLGYSVAGAGDVNNDGYDDVVAGAYMISRAYIYLGGAAMNAVADVVLIDDYVGVDVAGAGDVNGDGFDDVIATADGWVNLYFGGSPMNGAEDRTFFIDSFQSEISGAGDVNGDGYADIVLGEASVPTKGKAYIFHGGANMNLIPDVILSEGAINDWFGISVAKAGNINGDAYSDVIVASTIDNNDEANSAFIYYGGSPMNTVKDRTLGGRTVSGVANWNGDGRGDFMVGFPGLYGTPGNPGAVTVYYSKYYSFVLSKPGN